MHEGARTFLSACLAHNPRGGQECPRSSDDDKQLTDGIYTTGYFWTQKRTVGWRGGKPVVITLDLGKAEPIRGVSFNTAAGTAGVTWPAGINVRVSDNAKPFHEAGELTGLSGTNGVAPATGYAVHRYWTDALHTHGRYVMFLVAGESDAFVDEIEVCRGEAALLNTPLAGEAVTDPAAFLRARQVATSVARRLHADAQGVSGLATNAPVSAKIREQVGKVLDCVEAGIPSLPQRYDKTFRAVLPLNALHRQVFRALARI